METLDIRQLPEMQKLLGLYKIRLPYLEKLVAPVVTNNGRAYKGASRYELFTVIYLCRIADASGRVEDFKCSSLEDVLGCSKRHCDNIIKGLEQKGFIRGSREHWTGLMTITMPGNDFSRLKKEDFKNPHNHYLNLNNPFLFNQKNPCREKLKGLSLYALRLLLLIAYSYNLAEGHGGYQVSLDSLADKVGLKVHNHLRNRKLVKKYIDEINACLGGIITVYPSKAKRRKYDLAFIPAGEASLKADNGISLSEDSYYKRSLRLFLDRNCVTMDDESGHWRGNSVLLSEFSMLLFNTTLECLSRKIPMERIRKTVSDVLLTRRVLNRRSEAEIRFSLLPPPPLPEGT